MFMFPSYVVLTPCNTTTSAGIRLDLIAKNTSSKNLDIYDLTKVTNQGKLCLAILQMALHFNIPKELTEYCAACGEI